MSSVNRVPQTSLLIRTASDRDFHIRALDGAARLLEKRAVVASAGPDQQALALAEDS
jgi:hypothetical protein